MVDGEDKKLNSKQNIGGVAETSLSLRGESLPSPSAPPIYIMYIPGGAVIWARKTIDSDIFFWKPDKWFKIWFFIVGHCNHKDNSLFKRGENFFTYKEISRITKATTHQVDQFIRWGKKQQMLTTRKTTRGMVIKVIKYEVYQELDNYKNDKKNETQTKHKRNINDTINKNDKNDNNDNNKKGKFIPPTLSELEAYTFRKRIHLDTNRFIDFYESKGWMVGKNKMKDWRAAARNWARGDKNKKIKGVDKWLETEQGGPNGINGPKKLLPGF